MIESLSKKLFRDDVRPPLLLAALALVYFGDLVLHPGQLLYADHSDFLALHLPSKVFLVRSWQETAELPLWDPHNFSGLPFIHDTQVSAFYPPHMPLLWLPAERIGAALSWIVLLHVIGAGWCMYAYARRQGLEPAFAFIAGMGYMFAGKWLVHVLHAGHYNMLPLAWLPLLLLWLEEAIRLASWLRATAAGAVFALFLLAAYPYVTLYVGLLVALWTLGPALADAGYLVTDNTPGRTWKPLVCWGIMGMWTAAVGIALGAVQLLPSVEAAGHATRSLGVAASPDMLRGGLESLVTFSGRGIVGQDAPGTPAAPPGWDYEGGVGLLWLALAIRAALLQRGVPRFRAAVALLVVGYVVLGAVLVQGMPPFRYFRLPSRALLLLALPMALLAATTLQSLLARSKLTGVMESVGARRVFLKVFSAILFVQGAYALLRWLQGAPIYWHHYWTVLPLTAALAVALLGRSPQPPCALLWAVLLLVDLWALTGWLAVVRPADEIYAPSKSVAELSERGAGRVMARNPAGSYSTRTPLWSNLADVVGLESVGGFNPTDVRRYKEYLQFITDVDEPLHPPQGGFTLPVLESFPVRNKALLDLLGVRYLLQPARDQAGTAPFLLEGEEDVAADPRWRKVLDDPSPRAFDFMAAGLVTLPPYVLYENRASFPRAFVAPWAEPMPDQPQILAKLKATDLRRTVLLEGLDARSGNAPAGAVPERRVTLERPSPNRVIVDLPAGPSGYLVLTDPAFPGWKCTVNDVPTQIYRADYLFRGVAVPEEACRVVFYFAPDSYDLGRKVSLATLILVLLLFAFAEWTRIRARATTGRTLSS